MSKAYSDNRLLYKLPLTLAALSSSSLFFAAAAASWRDLASAAAAASCKTQHGTARHGTKDVERDGAVSSKTQQTSVTGSSTGCLAAAFDCWCHDWSTVSMLLQTVLLISSLLSGVAH
jgi:hypothetical protein